MSVPWFHAPGLGAGGVAGVGSAGGARGTQFHWIPRDEARHALGSRRLGAGDSVVLFDGEGFLRDGVVTDERDHEGGLAIRLGAARSVERASPRIHLGVAVPKGDRSATLLEAAAALEAESITPLDCARSVVRFDGKQRGRFERILLEGCKQSHQAFVPRLMDSASPAKWCGEQIARGAAVAVAHPGGGPLAGAAAQPSGAQVAQLAIAIGPEGGFTEEEMAAMCAVGAWRFSLGDSILRIETAATVALARIRE